MKSSTNNVNTLAVTVGDLVQSVGDCLSQAHASGMLAFGHGTDNAFDEAAWLCLWRLQLSLDALAAYWQQPVTQQQVKSVHILLQERLQTRKPLAYLTQEAWLHGFSFYIDERAIIPRSFLAECLVDFSLEPWLVSDSYKALDLCTGNGSLAVLCALTYPDWHIDACDISQEALAVAQINVQRYALAQRITLLRGDGLAACTGTYDLILCNPPYVNSQSMAALPAEYRHEPGLALAGGQDGMDFIRPLLAQAAKFLSPKGILVLELGHEYDNFRAAFPTLEGIWLDTNGGEHQVILLPYAQLQ